LLHNLNTQFQSGKLSLAFEHKIKESAFSIQYEGNFLAKNLRYKENIYHTLNYQLTGGASLEGRWYYSLKRKIAQGKSGNNFNGCFVGVHNGFSSAKQVVGNMNEVNNSFKLLPIWGIQYRIFDKGFFEYRVGFGTSRKERIVSYAVSQPNIEQHFREKIAEPVFLSELKIGLAF
jgi:hypothetical protein